MLSLSGYYQSLISALENNDQVMNQDLNSEELIGEDINNVGQDDDYEVRDQEHPIDDIAKFRMFIPVLTKIGNLMASHGMLTFRKYVSDLKTIESKLRRGQRIFPSIKQDFSDLTDLDISNNNSEDDCCDDEEASETVDAPHHNEKEDDTDSEVDNESEGVKEKGEPSKSSKFKLTFKEKVKTKDVQKARKDNGTLIKLLQTK